MRTIRVIQTIYIVVLALLDLVFTSVFKNVPIGNSLFVSNLAFMGLVLLTRNDNIEDSVLKAAGLGLWMDMNHINSFPLYIVVYVVTILFVRTWSRYLGYNLGEFIVMVIIAIFFKEILLYIGLVLTQGYSIQFINYVSTRVFWVLLGNILLIPIVRKTYDIAHMQIVKRAKNMYVR